MLDLLDKYIRLLGNLHRNYNPHYDYAPHKPILLLALLAEIERGHIQNNLVAITPELVAAFRDYWRTLVPSDTWGERLVYPFRYLIQEGFWELVKNGVALTKQELGSPTSLGQLRAMIDGGRFAPDFWRLLQDRASIQILRDLLLQKYFHVETVDIQPRLAANPINYEIEKLKAEAQSRFRVRQVSEAKDETGYFVRHALFPKVIKELYHDACAVCRLATRTAGGSGLIDAAHIMPFAEFHNDDPRNGIALCKNHHWGFDSGWFTVSDEHRILISPHLHNTLSYITADVPLHLPADIEYAPAPTALSWHRTNVYRK